MTEWSLACERNKEPILGHLRDLFAGSTRVLEVGSGTGQHARHFAAALPHLTWQPSERPGRLAALTAQLAGGGLANLHVPVGLDVSDPAWPEGPFDAVFTANTLHIMSWDEVGACVCGIARALAHGGTFACYGPFSYHGRHTSESNAAFDAQLKSRDPQSGIRDVEQVDLLAQRAGLFLADDLAMPANNRLLVWRPSGRIP